MKSNISKIICSLFLTIAILSCSKNGDLLVINVEKEFDIHLVERLGSSDNEFELIITTIHNQECENAAITYSKDQNSSNIGIRINGVDNPVDCVPGESPVSESIPLIIEEGGIDIEISLQDEVSNTGRFDVDGTHYEIQMDTDHGIIYSDTKYSRIPNFKVWGYFSASDSEIANSFSLVNKELKDGAQLDLANLLEGNYYYFKINDNQAIEGQQISQSSMHTMEFVYTYHMSIEDIQNTVDALEAATPGLDIYMTTSNGDIID